MPLGERRYESARPGALVFLEEWRESTVWFDQMRQERWSSQMFAPALEAATGISPGRATSTIRSTTSSSRR